MKLDELDIAKRLKTERRRRVISNNEKVTRNKKILRDIGSIEDLKIFIDRVFQSILSKNIKLKKNLIDLLS